MAESWLPIPVLVVLLFPVAAIMATCELASSRRHATFRQLRELSSKARNAGLDWGRSSLPTVWTVRLAMCMSRLTRYWPERIKEPRWSARCQFIGFDRVEAILAGGRPIVLVTLHYANLTQLYNWIRARGIGVSFLALTNPRDVAVYRTSLDVVADRVNGLEGVPNVIGIGYLELWRVREFLGQPNRVLAVAAEGFGKRDIIARGPGYTLRMGPGALHIASMTQAAVIPCLMNVEKNLKATIFFGAPLPDELVADRDRHALACEKIIEQLGPRISARPEQAAPVLIRALNFNGGRA